MTQEVNLENVLSDPVALVACAVAYRAFPAAIPATPNEIARMLTHHSPETARNLGVWSGSEILLALGAWTDALNEPRTPPFPPWYACEILDRACPWLRTRVDGWDVAETMQGGFADGEESILVAAAYALEGSPMGVPWLLFESARGLTGAYQLAWANMAYPVGAGVRMASVSPVSQDLHRRLVTAHAMAFATRIVADVRWIESVSERKNPTNGNA